MKTLCIAVLKKPITLQNGTNITMFRKYSDSEKKIISSIPFFLAKNNKKVWYDGKEYQLPIQTKLLSNKLLTELSINNIICECVII